jgi:L-fuconolactonase
MSKLEDWLSLTVEPTIEPDLPICDSHHHLRRYGQQKYVLTDFLNDACQGHNILRTVVVESMFNRATGSEKGMTPLEETEYVITQIKEKQSGTNVGAGIIGHADLLLGDAVAPVLEHHILAGDHRFRGIRVLLGKAEDNGKSWSEDVFLNNDFLEGFATLQEYKLTFDLLVRHHQLMGVVGLAKRFPDTSIVINHIGCPILKGGDETIKETVTLWKRGIAALAELENVYLKLGGLGMDWFNFGWDKLAAPPNSIILAKTKAPYLLFCIEKFGPERCMFESNFPVDKKSYSYSVLWNAFKRITRDFSAGERLWLFHNTAAKVYDLQKAELPEENRAGK